MGKMGQRTFRNQQQDNYETVWSGEDCQKRIKRYQERADTEIMGRWNEVVLMGGTAGKGAGGTHHSLKGSWEETRGGREKANEKVT